MILKAKYLQRTSLVLIRKHSRSKDKLIKETIDSVACKSFDGNSGSCNMLCTFVRVNPFYKSYECHSCNIETLAFFWTELEFGNIADFETRRKKCSERKINKYNICSFTDTAPIETATQI